MHVHELMTSPAATSRSNDTLETAACLLWENNCGFLPVVDGQGQLGAIITDRDICMGAYTKSARLADLMVADSMSQHLVTCQHDESVVAAAKTMAKHQVRRLPVVDTDGKLCGVISLSDLATKVKNDAAIGRETLKALTAASHQQPLLGVVVAPTRVGVTKEVRVGARP
jgi:CBS domain-containing protein